LQNFPFHQGNDSAGEFPISSFVSDFGNSEKPGEGIVVRVQHFREGGIFGRPQQHASARIPQTGVVKEQGELAQMMERLKRAEPFGVTIQGF
jgi:hypothetical protein